MSNGKGILELPGEFENMLARAMGDATQLFPNTLAAIQGVAQAAQARWIAYASGSPLPDGKVIRRQSGSYAASIGISSELNGAVIRYVIFSDDPKARMLEDGTRAWDMKAALGTSAKVRRRKDGKRYLIVPFRWGSRGSLAVGAYSGREIPVPTSSFFLKRQASFIRDTYKEASPNGGTATRYWYSWGDRLTMRDIGAMGIDTDSKLAGQLQGMVKMRNPDDARLGSSFMTFRVMSEDSSGWIHPGIPAYQVSKHVQDFVNGIYPEMLNAAMNADVAALEARAAGQ